VSAVTQVTLPGLLIVAVIDGFIKDVPLRWWWISVGGVTAVAFGFAVVIATATYMSIWRKAKFRG